MVSDIVVNVDTHPVQASADSDSDPPPQKKLKHDGDITTSFLADLLRATRSQNTEEVDSYLACSDKCDDVLAYWHSKQTTWPKLSECVKRILSIPATSTSSEHSFSTAGRTLDKR